MECNLILLQKDEQSCLTSMDLALGIWGTRYLVKPVFFWVFIRFRAVILLPDKESPLEPDSLQELPQVGVCTLTAQALAA